MSMKLLREYGVETSIDFSLFDPTGVDLITTASYVAGDINISIDGAGEAPTTNGFTNVDQGYRLVVSAAEVTGKSMRIPIVDQDVTKIWRDDFVIIETYGHANAMHPSMLGALIDGVTVEHIHELLMAMVNGRFLKDTPADGNITFYKRDNTTPLTVTDVDEDSGERTRVSP